MNFLSLYKMNVLCTNQKKAKLYPSDTFFSAERIEIKYQTMNLNDKKLKLHFQRFEFKYQIPVNLIDGLLPELLKYMEWDPYVKEKTGLFYYVSSLYFDSIGYACYYQNLSGERTRKKLRIRFYDEKLSAKSPVFLEIKKKYDSVVIKDRLTTTMENCNSILEGNLKKIDSELSLTDRETLNDFLWLKYHNSMVPQNMVIYKRKPLISKVDPSFRVTFDYELATYCSARLNDRKYGYEVMPQLAVMEVKFNNMLPFWFHQILQKYNLQRMAFSKYCRCLEVCKPELAENIFQIYQPQSLNISY
ncbi:polyphosphate polymerase domain-containing protein [Candidatus Parcubacteria bacterium]|nr:MAG: polyphosphate polymerase domain-containing protein [Candidatus Parcubacteria bacterium]